ncbi:MAG TPA: serine/threonine-protein kinase [Chthoniobacteraceae bacterium]|nr:serine/threonine-protein kinase [Chthoniobacteraceae bacterium]
METPRSCPQCQQPLAADAPDGLCPACLLKAAAEPAPVSGIEGTPYDIIDIGDPVEVGKKLPQFEILRMLGRGGMGVVYQACQRQLDRMVAIKILPPVDALSRDFVARFTREARSLAKLNHPNIVNVHDFGESGGLYYIVMEFVDGANLRELFETGKLTPAEALAIVPKICDALEYAHEEGIVHRDIKPENILIDKKGRVKIADFGLAKLLRREALDMSLTLSGTSLGTVRYMAPEQMDKPETVDHRADLYSLGVVIYEMLTGEVPVGRYELPSQKAQVDVRLDEIVLHALEREPARRYQHASEVREDVQRVTSGPGVRPAHPAPTPAVGSGEPQLSTRALVSLIWAVLGLMAMTFIVLAIADWQRGPDGLRQPIHILGFHVAIWALFAVSSVIGSIVLGSHAIVQIKRSDGRLYGLPVAAASALFYPLVLVGAVAFYVTNLLAATVVFNLDHSPTRGGVGQAGVAVWHFAVLDTLAALLVCFFVARSAWRKIVRPSAAAPSTHSGATPEPPAASPVPEHHVNQFLGFFMTPQPGYARQVGGPMIILTGVWMIVMLAVTFLVPEKNEAAHLATLGVGVLGIPLGLLFLSLRWAVRRGKSDAPTAGEPPSSGIGRASLWLAIGGVVVPILLALVAQALAPAKRLPDFFTLCVVLGFLAEVVALGCGFAGRKSAAGKAGLLSAGLLLIIGVLVGSMSAVPHEAGDPGPLETVQKAEVGDARESAPALPAAVPLKQAFMIGYGGPELTNEAVQKLKLSRLQSDEIGRILLSYHHEYLALQRRHSKVGQDDAGRLLVTIEPFYEECLELAQRLQTELGGIVDATVLPVIQNGEMATQIFSWGGACHETIAMWKADGKYYVEEKLTSAPGHERDPYTFNMSGPKLEEIPEGFRIYWRE